MSKSQKKQAPKRRLALPDLEQAKSAVLNSLSSASGQRTYTHAIDEFVGWCCSEPRLAFNRTVVLRYRIHLEQRAYAPATITSRTARRCRARGWHHSAAACALHGSYCAPVITERRGLRGRPRSTAAPVVRCRRQPLKKAKRARRCNQLPAVRLKTLLGASRAFSAARRGPSWCHRPDRV
jgi:hypothetical protein